MEVAYTGLVRGLLLLLFFVLFIIQGAAGAGLYVVLGKEPAPTHFSELSESRQKII